MKNPQTGDFTPQSEGQFHETVKELRPTGPVSGTKDAKEAADDNYGHNVAREVRTVAKAAGVPGNSGGKGPAPVGQAAKLAASAAHAKKGETRPPVNLWDFRPGNPFEPTGNSLARTVGGRSEKVNPLKDKPTTLLGKIGGFLGLDQSIGKGIETAEMFPPSKTATEVACSDNKGKGEKFVSSEDKKKK